MRIEYTWTREYGSVTGVDKPEYLIDRNADGMKSFSEVKAYLREFAKGWTGRGHIKIVRISDGLRNEAIDKISEKLAGQVIEFEDGKVVFKRG